MKWKLALAQHPMYLLIREDTQCAERTPPWGAPNIEAYIDRVRRNLQALDVYPQLRLGYEWSGVELELLSRDAPEVLQQMMEYARKKRLQFYNGTYAQPHLQILSSEANFRQFEYGSKVYREAGLPPVLTYAHQEASVHDQVPQLLSAFGLRFASAPGFLSTLVWLDEGELVLHGVRGPRFVQGHEFAFWQGLDGSQIPLYLHQPIPREYTLKETIVREEVIGRLRVPPVLIDMPDMIEIDDEWMAERDIVEFVLLDEILETRRMQSPARSRARLYTNWSYLEGIRAEELSRCNQRAERTALQAESLSAMAAILLGRPAESFDEIWKTILTCQHHDVYCFSAPELRDKAVGWLKKVQHDAELVIDRSAGDIAAQVDTSGPTDACMVVFNTMPHAQTGLVQSMVQVDDPTILTAQGEIIPVEALPVPGRGTRVRFIADLPGFGYQTFWIGSGSVRAAAVSVEQPFLFENPFYQAMVYPDGTFGSLIVKPGEVELLNAANGRGNRLSATDSTAISLKEESPDDCIERYAADPALRGPELDWEPSTPASLLRSPIGATLTVEGKLGPAIQAAAIIDFYHSLPRIDLTWRFTFDQASVGTFFDEDSKLLVQWPLGFTGDIYHDIPFGAVQTRDERSFFPTRWLDISDREKGLAFFHLGTPHYWIAGSTLFNLIAWGEDTDAIHNKLGRHRWLKSFDQRLNGTHTIRHALYPHMNDWRAADVIGRARDLHFPPLAVPITGHTGSLPGNDRLLWIDDPALSATALFTRGTQVVCRVYAANGEGALEGVQSKRIFNRELRRLSGERVTKLRPYQIGEIILERGTTDGSI